MTLSKRDITRLAWLEAKIATDYSTGLGEVARGTYHPPGGFVSVECGFGFAEGPSIMATMDAHARAARNGKRLLGDHRMVPVPKRAARRDKRAVLRGRIAERRDEFAAVVEQWAA